VERLVLVSEDLLKILIPAASALLGGIIGGTISLLTSRMTAKYQERQKKVEQERLTAGERIDKFYGQLYKMVSFSPPYDDYHLERDECGHLINFIEKNEKYASPDLLGVFWRFRFQHYNEGIETDTMWNMIEIINEEFIGLKNTLGYGSIVKRRKLHDILKKLNKKADRVSSSINIKTMGYKRKMRRWLRKKKD
jgi:hypothetical protein